MNETEMKIDIDYFNKKLQLAMHSEHFDWESNTQRTQRDLCEQAYAEFLKAKRTEVTGNGRG